MKTTLLSLSIFVITCFSATCQDLSGTWSGSINQGKSPMYTFIVKINQEGSELSGTCEIINTYKKNGVTEKFQGTFTNNEISLTETSVIRYKMSPSVKGWCLKILSGTLTTREKEYVIEGTWTSDMGFTPGRGYSNSDCEPGIFRIAKAISSKDEPPTLSQSDQKESGPILLKNVLFELQTDKLFPQAYAELDTLVIQLKEKPQVRIRLEGHTDYIKNSSAQGDLLLSEKRVNKVKGYLIKKGIKGDRIETKGYGHSKPLLPPPNEANRRVEFVILN
ncbi:OmpA family protein [Larkinella rosea]|uniref:OmpA family protein n=2 Tax=Larkinella rosea TaxID=2025312 RepID=A0A3P1C3K4_9BACT|nr:OmpA family protein [Larkinella rosea]